MSQGFCAQGGHADAAEDQRLPRAVAISQEKIHTLADFWPLTGALLDDDDPVDDPKARERWLGEEGREALRDVREALAELDGFTEPDVTGALEAVLARRQVKPREVYQPLRVAIAGTTVSPGIFESVALLGREETLRMPGSDAGCVGGDGLKAAVRFSQPFVQACR